MALPICDKMRVDKYRQPLNKYAVYTKNISKPFKNQDLIQYWAHTVK